MFKNGTIQVKDLSKESILTLIDLATSWGKIQKEFEESNDTMYKTCDTANEALEFFKEECKKMNLSFRAKHSLLSIGYFLTYGNDDALEVCPEKHPR